MICFLAKYRSLRLRSSISSDISVGRTRGSYPASGSGIGIGRVLSAHLCPPCSSDVKPLLG